MKNNHSIEYILSNVLHYFNIILFFITQRMKKSFECLCDFFFFFTNLKACLCKPLSSIAPLVPSGILKLVPAFVLSTSCRAWQSDRWPVLPGNSRDMAKSHPGARSIADSNGTRDGSIGSSSPAHLGCCPALAPFHSVKRESQQGQNRCQTIPAISPHAAWQIAWF